MWVRDSDLECLQRLPIRSLILTGCKSIGSLSGLQGLPLTRLDLGYCSSSLHQPLVELRGMKLKSLDLRGWDLGKGLGLGLGAVAGMGCGGLLVLKGLPLTSLNLGNCFGLGAWGLAPLRANLEALPLSRLNLKGYRGAPSVFRRGEWLSQLQDAWDAGQC